MNKAGYALLQDVIMDPDFPDLDLALRRGRHVDRDDAAWYALLSDAQELLESFYRRYGCELIHKTDGYFYLLPTGDKVSRKQLAATDMLVGQALALLYLDPAAIERGGVVTHEELVAQLSTVLGTDTLIAAFNPGKRKRFDERIAQRNVRSRVAESVRRLAHMGFVDSTDGDRVRLRSALLRFAEPVRGLSEPAEALAKLVAQGEVALAPEEPESGEGDDDAGLDANLADDDDLAAADGVADDAIAADEAIAADDVGLAAAPRAADSPAAAGSAVGSAADVGSATDSDVEPVAVAGAGEARSAVDAEAVVEARAGEVDGAVDTAADLETFPGEASGAVDAEAVAEAGTAEAGEAIAADVGNVSKAGVEAGSELCASHERGDFETVRADAERRALAAERDRVVEPAGAASRDAVDRSAATEAAAEPAQAVNTTDDRDLEWSDILLPGESDREDPA